MKKRIAALMITTIFALTGAGCSQNDPSEQAADSSNAQEEAAEDGNAQEATEDTGDTASSDMETAQEGQSESSNVLIAYFSVPEDADTEGIDANAGASVVVREGQVMGNLEYMADVIQQTIGGQLLADLAGTGDWQDGMRFGSRPDEADVQEWVNGLGL